jgi:cellulose synthase/poly-beta-1,6-N-acetylglucosamine synthase-like glycosyltransferase
VDLWIAARRGGKTEVLNHLVPLIDADVILFTDANTMHHPDSLKKLVRSFADPAVGGVAGNIRHRGAKKEREERLYRSFETMQKYYESRLHSSISAFGGFYSIRKSLFRPIHHNAYSNDDVLIPMNLIRRGFRVVFDPEALSEEDMTESIAQEFSRRIRIGAGNFQAFFWLLDFLNPLRGWPWFCYVSHKVARWFSPFFLGATLLCGVLLWLLTSQAVFSIVPLLGTLFLAVGLSFLLVPKRINRTAFYFLTMNAALALGLVRFCKGIHSAAWTRTEREKDEAAQRRRGGVRGPRKMKLIWYGG